MTNGGGKSHDDKRLSVAQESKTKGQEKPKGTTQSSK